MTGSRPLGSVRLRRSHTLGACRTCRRRHVKCDQKRPTCRTCRALGVACEGFSNEVRWMRNSGSNDADDHHGTRRHLYTEQSRLSMSTSLGSDLVSGSINASLAEIDLRSRDPDRSPTGDIVVGPFAVLDFAPAAPQGMPRGVQPSQVQGTTPEPALASTPPTVSSDFVAAEEVPAFAPMSSKIDSLSHIDDFLHWSDLLGLSPDQPGFFQPPTLDVDMCFGSDPRGLDPESNFGAPSYGMAGDAGPVQRDRDQRDTMRMMTPPHSTAEMASTILDAAPLADAPLLFKNFHENVIPQMMAMPLGEKSPWKILNMPSAMGTYSDLTILGSQNISHARLANLYGVLACSAIHLALKPSIVPVDSIEHWQQAADQMFQQARDYMQMSLKYETQEPKRAKYKDQLMAICCLTEYAARLLHHVYTWLRLVGESTYVLHDYNPSNSFIEALDSNFRRRRPDQMAGQDGPAANERNPRLDDFLRLEAHYADSDLNIDEPKDRETGLHDIHLQDSRSFSDTLYKQIYGIPETWLSLLSQTTRLANVMETFRIAQRSYKNTTLEAWETLQKRSVHLENMICSFVLGRIRGVAPEHVDPSRPHGHMLRALNEALVIFFYRRIRQAHPAILAGHVDSVIAALADFNVALPQDQATGPGTAWPAFVAGCEALTSSRRQAIMQWLDKAESTCGFAAFKTARNIMKDLWRKQDEHLDTNRRDPMPTWIDIVKERQIWPLFC
ncbi:hypothetical protein EYZ11_006205 [Aspergillus tanneri]|uniref:Zn(2)-C6 fungal-type domain-containing protein n=1 Tax=Aspergillus tanneri TaxID=1220188 RepID=A0A4S3JG35_9EURO|nr:hypothetical protein EYZ11_006205 [Aspergillus tanneri]